MCQQLPGCPGWYALALADTLDALCSQLCDQGTDAAERGVRAVCELLCGELAVQLQRPGFL